MDRSEPSRPCFRSRGGVRRPAGSSRCRPSPSRRGISLLEIVVAALAIAILAAVLLPWLAGARVDAYRRTSQDNLRQLGTAWAAYLETFDGSFPHLPVLGAWQYGGVRFLEGRPFLDPNRPLTSILNARDGATALFRCPADRGIGTGSGVGTGRRTAYEAFGTSYRANALLFDVEMARALDREVRGRGEEGDGDERTDMADARGVRVGELRTVPSRLVVMGEPLWWELREGTGREADWFDDGNRVNVLFLDGSVKHAEIRPRPGVGPAVVEPAFRGAWEHVPETESGSSRTPDAVRGEMAPTEGGRAEQAPGAAG